MSNVSNMAFPPRNSFLIHSVVMLCLFPDTPYLNGSGLLWQGEKSLGPPD
jgi:hypothetical protein